MGREVLQWRIRCLDSGLSFFVDQNAGEAAPTVCPDDPAHAVFVTPWAYREAPDDLSELLPPPTASDDRSAGWFVGAEIQASDGNAYRCDDDTNGAAVWSQISEGAPGSISVLDEGVVVVGGPHTAINFTGAGVTASDAGGGQVDVDIPGGGTGGVFDDYLAAYSNGRSSTSGGWQSKVTMAFPAEDRTFLLFWTSKLDSDGVGRTRIRDTTNNSNLVDIHDFKPTDNNDDDRMYTGWIQVVQTVAGGARTVALQFRSKDGNEMGIRNAGLLRLRRSP